MSDRGGSRFALEVLFLGALAVGLALSSLQPLTIVGIMFLGWVLVAVIEWACWRDAPHYGSGLPPRYYVPRVSLPPAQPLEQVATGYPEAERGEAPTWIASAALREEMLGAWPLATPERPADGGDHEPAPAGAEGAVDRWQVAELPAEPLAPPETAAEPEPEPKPEPEPEPEPEPVLERPAPAPELASAADEPLPDPAEEEAAAIVPLREARVGAPEQRRARYTLDPLAEPPRKRRLRRSGEPPHGLDVAARPVGIRPLPGTASE